MASEPRRILIVRLSAIGDVILASGLIPALKARWPEAELAWLTESGQADLLRHHPGLARLHLLPRTRWARAWRERRWVEVGRELRAFVTELRAARYDLVLDVQGLLKSGVLARLTGAPERIGLGSKEGSGWLMTRVVSRAVASHRPGKEYRALAAELGAPEAAYRLEVALAEADRARAGALLAEAGVGGEFAVCCPFTTRPQKHWFEERWIDLARRIQRELGLRVVILGGPGDREASLPLAEAAGAVNLVGRTGLGEAGALIERARLLIGVDTGLTHLGLAMGTPTLALFGSTRPYLEPMAPRSRVLYVPRDCSPCRRRPTCAGRFDCMRAHEVDAVLAAARVCLS